MLSHIPASDKLQWRPQSPSHTSSLSILPGLAHTEDFFQALGQPETCRSSSESTSCPHQDTSGFYRPNPPPASVLGFPSSPTYLGKCRVNAVSSLERHMPKCLTFFLITPQPHCNCHLEGWLGTLASYISSLKP